MATKQLADLDFGAVARVIRALFNPVSSDPTSPVDGEIWLNTSSGRFKGRAGGATVELATLADVTAGSITGALWDAQSVVTAIADDTPLPTVLGEATVLGRLAGGNIGAVTHAQLLAALEALGITADTVGSSSEAALLNRSNHTGTQAAATISDFATEVDARIDNVVAGAPGLLDTLDELAAAIGDDENFATTVNTALAARTQKYAETFGDAAATSIAITHNLGSLDVVVNVYEVAGGAGVECDVIRTNTNTVTLGFAAAPALNELRVVVVG